ncbi:cell division protein FtsK, partial [Kitasatospora sp. NPDC057692]
MRQVGIPLKQLSGIKVAGMPGYGKTMLMLAWMASLANRASVQFAVFDGKTADPRYGDWGE